MSTPDSDSSPASLNEEQRTGSADSGHVDELARILDTAFEIPILRVKFGVDAILGLLPGIGDLTSAIASAYIVHAAHQRGLPRSTLLRMLMNITVDSLIGAIPIVGDLFDLVWKSNRRNAELLRTHLAALPRDQQQLKRADHLFVVACLSFIAFLTAATMFAGYFVMLYVVKMFNGGVFTF
jgi:hypothetical protein